MERLQKMQEDVERAIKNYDKKAHSSAPQEEGQPAPASLRERLDQIIHSHKFMISIVVLVILDCLMVIAVLLFDLKIVELAEEHMYVHEIFHFSSLAILCLFLIEIGVRLYVMRLTFFKHKLEVFDAIVVIISFVLDIVFTGHHSATDGTGLLILLRLWRVARIVNGIVLSVKKQAEEKVENEKFLRKLAEGNILKYKKYAKALQAEIDYLKDILRANKIDFDENERPSLECA